MAKSKTPKVDINEILKLDLQILELEVLKYSDGIIYDDLTQQITELKKKLMLKE